MSTAWRTSLGAAVSERFIRWALRVKPPEPTLIRFGQRRVYVLPTRAGVLYAMSLLVMLTGAINYNLSLGYALVFLLAGLGITAILQTFRNLAGLSLTLGLPEPVFAGDPARFPVFLHNDTPRQRTLIRLAAAGQTPVTADIPAHDTTRILLPVATTRRGWCELPRITPDTVWPLGLIRAWAYAAPAGRCLVYPHPADAVPPAPTFGDPAGGKLSSDGGDEDFAGLRRHQPSDPPHHVAWKTAARQGSETPLQTKQFSGSATPVLWFDWKSLPPHLDTEMRLSILTRWVLDADAAGHAWGLRLPGRQLGRAHGPAHLHACLQALALHGS